MKKVRKLASLLLALVMTLSLSVPTYAVNTTDNGANGTITITNATIGESYHFYKLFDAAYGKSYTVIENGVEVEYIPTTYFATATQKEALEATDGNVFDFTLLEERIYQVSYTDEIGTEHSGEFVTETKYKELLANSNIPDLEAELYSDGVYQVTVKSSIEVDGDDTTVNDAMVIAFVKSFVVELSGGVTACYFPGAVEVTEYSGSGIENCVATASTVVVSGLPYGYYFVTSSLGSVISLDTTNDTATIKDKNDSTPTWDNDIPVPDDPVKSVLEKTEVGDDVTYRDIDGERVEVGQTLTYQISYTNTSEVTLEEVVVTDAPPEGTEYVDSSIGITFYYTDEGVLTAYTAIEDTDNSGHIEISDGTDTIILTYQFDDSDVSSDGLKWTIENLPTGVTLVAEFQVKVTDDALENKNPDKTVVNDADLEVTLGKNTYDLKTNTVENPVDEDDPVKDVVEVETSADGSYDVTDAESINGNNVSVGDILTYTISYTVVEEDLEVEGSNEPAETTSMTIEDAPPTGTVYVNNSAAGNVYDADGNALDLDISVTVDSSNNITWAVDGLALGYEVVVSFQVEVTEAALTITTSTITNEAEVTIGDNTSSKKTNTVSNPVTEEEPEKDVVEVAEGETFNGSETSIDGEIVSVGDVLTYRITYEVPEAKTGNTLGTLTIVDAPPEGTTYVDESAGVIIQNSSVDVSEYNTTDYISIDDDGNITWTLNDTENDGTIPLGGGEIVIAYFQVIVQESALENDGQIVENEADVTMGENTYTTNLVENPVDEPDDPEPEKDVKNSEGTSIDKESVTVGDILTYTIEYKYVNNDGDGDPVDLTIVDEPPTGTIYISGSAEGKIVDSSGTTILDDESVIEGEDGQITWIISDLTYGSTVTVSFQVYVTSDALTITSSTIENQADVTIGENTYKTNIVKNPVEPPSEFGKVIVNDDGTYTTISTGSYGDTVTFDVSVDAVNNVKKLDENGDEVDDVVQVAAYYIYDQLDPGLTLDKDSFVLTIGGVEYNVEMDEDQDYTDKEVTTYTIYTIVEEDSTDEPVEIGTLFVAENYNGEYTLIEVTIPWVTETEDDEGNITYSALYGNWEIHLICSATINENAVIAGTGNYNRAIYDYSTIDDDKPITPDPENPTYPSGTDLNYWNYEVSTQTFTYALGIQKVDKGTGEPLKNANFTAVDSAGNTVYAVYNEEDGCYYYTAVSEDAEDDTDAGTAAAAAETGTEEEEDEEEEVEITDTFITDENGQIVIKGVDIGTYTFTETKAPHGYVRIKTPIYVTAAMSSNSETSETVSYTETRYFEAITAEELETYAGDVYIKNEDGSFTMVDMSDSDYDEDTTYYQTVWSNRTSSASSSTSQWYTFDLEVTSLIVENTLGSTLTSTGGMGTTIFYIVGGILVLGAAIVLITRRRMRSE